MNYLHFFQFKTAPFDKKSDGGFSFQSKVFTQAKERLEIIRQSGGIFCLYGEYGTGKSALLYQWAASLPHQVSYVYLDYVKASSYGILFLINRGFCLPQSYSKVKLVCALKDYFKSAAEKPIIIIDEAHELANETLDDIRMLTSQDFDTDSSFVLIFSAHTSFFTKLSRHQALKQRINLSYELIPFSRQECSAYLKQRIKAAGCNHFPFTLPAEDKIFEYSAGIARKINKIATLSLMVAASSALNMIDERVCESVIIELSKNV